MLPPLRTRDIDLDVSGLAASGSTKDIPKLLAPLGLEAGFHADGSLHLSHQLLSVEFLVRESGKGTDAPFKLPGFGIVAQPLRYLDFVEQHSIVVDYEGFRIHLPNPARFAVHKLMVSQRRRRDRAKAPNDVRQALSVMSLLARMGKQQEIVGIVTGLTRKQKRLMVKALQIPESEFPPGLYPFIRSSLMEQLETSARQDPLAH